MTDSLDTLSKLTALTRNDMLEIAEQVRANQERLNGCDYHQFEPIASGKLEAALQRRYRCRFCGGDIDSHAYYWFNIGRGRSHKELLRRDASISP